VVRSGDQRPRRRRRWVASSTSSSSAVDRSADPVRVWTGRYSYRSKERAASHHRSPAPSSRRVERRHPGIGDAVDRPGSGHSVTVVTASSPSTGPPTKPWRRQRRVLLRGIKLGEVER
jgi:hypothetical protein